MPNVRRHGPSEGYLGGEAAVDLRRRDEAEVDRRDVAVGRRCVDLRLLRTRFA
jgi:hypothetical protein